MIAGPEIAGVIGQFEVQKNHKVDTRHHDQTSCAGFARDVDSLVSVIEELGNPFKEEA